MKRVKIALIFCATLALGMIVSAALIGVGGYVNPTNVPQTQFVGPSNVVGALTYNAGTRNLTLNVADAGVSTPFSSRFVAFAPLKPHYMAPVANSPASVPEPAALLTRETSAHRITAKAIAV